MQLPDFCDYTLNNVSTALENMNVRFPHEKCLRALVLPFVITVTYAPSAAASDARSEAAPPAPEGLVGLKH